MSLILQIFGAAFLLLIGLLIVGGLVVRSKIRSFARNLEQTMGGLSKVITASGPPSRLHLTNMARADWADERAVEGQTEPLPGLGFTLVGDYQAEEVSGFGLEAWVNPKESVYAVVYEHPKAGVWIDFVTRYLDGTRVTYANSTQGAGVDHAPGHDVQRFPGLDAASLYEKFLEGRADKPREPVSRQEFVALFEKAYADEMDWRNSRGGVTEEEIRAIAKLSGEPYDENVIQVTRRMAEEHAMTQLDEALRERFLKQTPMAASEWEGVRDRVVVIHDRMTPSYFSLVLSNLLEDETFPELDGSPEAAPRKVFAELNSSLADDRKFKKLGSIREPVEADVYASPEYTDDYDDEDEDD